ncbi:MAG: DUF1499 domain-containing protein [Myxococcota bacterium]|nr:DUF1499 domain-containing protein [Myxococcota bacterium]
MAGFTGRALVGCGGALFLLGLGCVGPSTAPARSSPGWLAACPGSPNCVSSDSRSGTHQVAPLKITGDSDAAWAAIGRVVGSLPGCTVARRTELDLHAECRSKVFRFVDDLDLQRRPRSGVVAVRSASRVGYGDLGVNRRRVEQLRSRLAAEGILRKDNFELQTGDEG